MVQPDFRVHKGEAKLNRGISHSEEMSESFHAHVSVMILVPFSITLVWRLMVFLLILSSNHFCVVVRILHSNPWLRFCKLLFFFIIVCPSLMPFSLLEC